MSFKRTRKTIKKLHRKRRGGSASSSLPNMGSPIPGSHKYEIDDMFEAARVAEIESKKRINDLTLAKNKSRRLRSGHRTPSRIYLKTAIRAIENEQRKGNERYERHKRIQNLMKGESDSNSSTKIDYSKYMTPIANLHNSSMKKLEKKKKVFQQQLKSTKNSQ